MLGLDPLAPDTPRLPHRRFEPLTRLAASAALHLSVVLIATLIKTLSPSVDELHRNKPGAAQQAPPVPHLVFLAPALPRIGGGGGGGGNQESGQIRRAQGVGSNTTTLRTRKPPPAPEPQATTSSPPAEDVSLLPAIALDARPLTTGIVDQIGLPTGATLSGTSQGPGSGGGVGTGVGTGTGPGSGSGLGPGAGGGAGGGAYRAGGGVSAPRVIQDVQPRYTKEALRNGIQGTVVMEVIVASNGRPSHIRVVSSLHRELDDEAVAAVARWRFEPGRLAGEPVDVLVTIMLDFRIR